MGIFRKSYKRIQMDREKTIQDVNIKDHFNARLKSVDAFDLASFLSKDELKVDWSARRKRIDWSLAFLGTLITIIIIALLTAVFYGKTLDPNYSYIFSGALMFLLLAFVSILGAYTLGPSFEANNLRKAATNMYSSMMYSKNGSNAPSVPVTATTTTETNIVQGNPDTRQEAG